jgi:hypothetical protein
MGKWRAYGLSRSAAVSRRGGLNFAAIFRAVAMLVLIAQLGMVAHRIEHYLAPEHMECGEDGCDAFAPALGPAAPVPFLPPLFFVVFFLKFWTLRDSVTEQPGSRLGFRAHAPPV